MMPKSGDIRVWHIPRVPGKPFQMDVPTFKEGLRLLDTLAVYDFVLMNQGLLESHTNAQGLFVYDGEEWVDTDPNDAGDLELLNELREG